MTPDERRAYVRARLVALAEEVMMVTRPKPTEEQLRQHALDRAVTDGMVSCVYGVVLNHNGSTMTGPAEVARAVTQVADVFVEYLRGPAPDPEELHYDENTLRMVYAGLNEAGVPLPQAEDAVRCMQNRGILFRERSA